MKAGEVLRVLNISRPTLHRWKMEGIVRTVELPSGHFDYNDEDVYKILNKGVKRKTYIYARVSTKKQKKDLENQVECLKQWVFMNGYTINGIFTDIASGISFDKRKDFFVMLDDILDHRVERVIITHKDRLSRVGLDLFNHLFSRFGTEIIVISDVGNSKIDSEEIFEEIVSLLHCYSMKLYSKRRRKSIEVTVDEG